LKFSGFLDTGHKYCGFFIVKLLTMKNLITIIPVATLLLASCSKTGTTTQPSPATNAMSTATQQNSTTGAASTSSGIGTAIPAYYDSTLFKIIFSPFSPQAAASEIAHNKNINFIYQSDNGLPNNQPFISVINAIQRDGFNPIWREVQIVFNPGFTPRQLYSDNEVLAAASGTHPEITLNMTNEVYWCPVVGPK